MIRLLILVLLSHILLIPCSEIHQNPRFPVSQIFCLPYETAALYQNIYVCRHKDFNSTTEGVNVYFLVFWEHGTSQRGYQWSKLKSGSICFFRTNVTRLTVFFTPYLASSRLRYQLTVSVLRLSWDAISGLV